MQLRRVCAWCQAVLNEGSPGAEVTHGICEPCADRLAEEDDLAEEEALPVHEGEDRRLVKRVQAKVQANWGGQVEEATEGGPGRPGEPQEQPGR